MALIEVDFETEVKVIVVGDGEVGKTSMIRRYCKGKFTENYRKTIGVDYLERLHTIPSRGEDVRMMVWDTAGQEEFDAVTRTYYRGAAACVLAFSSTDRASFEHVMKWQSKVAEECGDIVTVLVQNKVDLLEEAEMTSDEAEALAEELGVRFYRVSVKDNLNVDEVFEYLADEYLKELYAQRATSSTAATTTSGRGKKSAGNETVAVANEPSRVRTDGKKSWC